MNLPTVIYRLLEIPGLNMKVDFSSLKYLIYGAAPMSVEKLKQKVEANVHLSGKNIFVECADANMYAAIDFLADKLDRQIIKHKEKHLEHRTSPVIVTED